MSKKLHLFELSNGRSVELHVTFKALDQLDKLGVDPMTIIARAGRNELPLTMREAVTVLWVGVNSEGTEKFSQEEIANHVFAMGGVAYKIAVDYVTSFCAAGPAAKNA